jgi:hypothetical protein
VFREKTKTPCYFVADVLDGTYVSFKATADTWHWRAVVQRDAGVDYGFDYRFDYRFDYGLNSGTGS